MEEIVNEYDIELHFLVEATSKEYAIEVFKQLYGKYILEQADKIEITGD